MCKREKYICLNNLQLKIAWEFQGAVLKKLNRGEYIQKEKKRLDFMWMDSKRSVNARLKTPKCHIAVVVDFSTMTKIMTKNEQFVYKAAQGS